MPWHPLQDSHAIEKVRVICAFQADIRPKFSERLADLVEPMRADYQFGPVNKIQGQGLTFQLGAAGPVGQVSEQQVVGWSFQRTMPDGAVVESISLERSTIIYETSEYSTWTEFHRRAVPLLTDIVSELSTYDDMSTLALEYHDRFVFQGTPEEADPREIFELSSDTVLEAALDGGNLWHVHRGWFENASKGKLLVNQNLDAQEGQFKGEPARSVAVLTKLEARRINSELTSDSWTDLLPEMHTRSKDVLKEILKPVSAEMIGMT